MLNPRGTRAAAGELSRGVQAAALPVPTTDIGRDGGTKASWAVVARLRPNRRRVQSSSRHSLLFICAAAHFASDAPPHS